MDRESSLDDIDGDASLFADGCARPSEFNSCFSFPEETAVGDSSPSDSVSGEQTGGEVSAFFVAMGELDDSRREVNSEPSRSYGRNIFDVDFDPWTNS